MHAAALLVYIAAVTLVSFSHKSHNMIWQWVSVIARVSKVLGPYNDVPPSVLVVKPTSQ